MKSLHPIKHPDRRSTDNLVTLGELTFTAGAVCDALWDDLSLSDRQRLHAAAVRAMNRHIKELKPS